MSKACQDLGIYDTVEPSSIARLVIVLVLHQEIEITIPLFDQEFFLSQLSSQPNLFQPLLSRTVRLGEQLEFLGIFFPLQPDPLRSLWRILFDLFGPIVRFLSRSCW